MVIIRDSRLKVLIVGSTGFLGSSLIKNLDPNVFEIYFTSRDMIDLGTPIKRDFENFLKNQKFNYMIISAAISDVELCFKNQVLSNQVNIFGMIELLKLALRYNIFPIFFSSDYVFSGKLRPYLEDDSRKPETVYGKQKLHIEKYIEENFKEYLIFRTSKLMSKDLNPRNILYPILVNLFQAKEINCFIDQILNPVFVEDVANVLEKAIPLRITGIFHLGTREILTRYEVGVLLAKSFGFDPELVKPIKMNEINFSEKRPHNNSLNCEKVEHLISFRFHELKDTLTEIRDSFSEHLTENS